MQAASAALPNLPADAEALRALVLATMAERDAAVAERDRLLAECDALAARNERLHALLLKLRRLQFGRKSERLPDEQLQLGLEDVEAAIAKNDAEAERQDPALRKKFTGTPEHAINYFFFVAEELREIMAKLGFRTFNEMIGRVDRIDTTRVLSHWKAGGVDLTKVLYQMPAKPGVAIYNCEKQNHGLEKALDHELIAAAKPALEKGELVRVERSIRNVNRTVGAMLSGEVAKRYGHAGLPEDTSAVKLTGTAGQSFGAFLARGVSLDLVGDANDYVGKGLSGGRVVVRQPKQARRDPTLDVFAQSAPGQEVVFLRDVTDLRADAADGFAAKHNPARARTEQTHDQVEQGRLAAAGRADNGDELALGDVEVNGLEGNDSFPAHMIFLMDAFDRE
jgi:hypothetical protein